MGEAAPSLNDRLAEMRATLDPHLRRMAAFATSILEGNTIWELTWGHALV